MHDELICYDEMKSLDGNACPNHLYELMLIIAKYYPESQTELVYQTQKAIAGVVQIGAVVVVVAVGAPPLAAAAPRSTSSSARKSASRNSPRGGLLRAD